MKKALCPLCHQEGLRCLLGPFPVWLCSDPGCSCGWGFFANFAFWLADKLQPYDEDHRGWMLFHYEGSYLGALWASLTHQEDE